MRFYRSFVTTVSNFLRAQKGEPSRIPLVTPAAVEEKKTRVEIDIKKLKLNDKELSQTITLIRSKRKLKKNEQIIVEGNILIVEAVQARVKLNKLIFSDQSKIDEIIRVLPSNAIRAVEFLKVPQADLSFYSVLQTCPGVIGIFDKPQGIDQKAGAYPIDVIADQIREPNNCSIIRVCSSLPANRLLLVKGNVDVWDTKSIRASSGSVFHFPTQSQLSWEDVDQQTNSESIILIADNNTRRYKREAVVEYDKIPEELFIQNRPISVIIGGESAGVSAEAVEFARMRNDWRCVKIPLDTSVNSLNLSNALAIILFELRRRMNNC